MVIGLPVAVSYLYEALRSPRSWMLAGARVLMRSERVGLRLGRDVFWRSRVVGEIIGVENRGFLRT